MNTIEQAEARAAAMRATWAGDTLLTPLGAAVVTVSRLRDQLAALTATDRDEVRELLAELASEMDARAWCQFGATLTAAIGEHRG